MSKSVLHIFHSIIPRCEDDDTAASSNQSEYPVFIIEKVSIRLVLGRNDTDFVAKIMTVCDNTVCSMALLSVHLKLG